MKKAVALLLFVILILNMSSGMGFAAETNTLELYEISYISGVCTVSGRLYTKADCAMTLTAKGQGESSVSTVTAETTGESDGSFVFTFEAESAQYQMAISASTGDSQTYHVDLSCISELMKLNSSGEYTIDGMSFRENDMTLYGSHAGTADGVVSLKLFDQSGAVCDPAFVRELAQTKTNEDGTFELKLQAEAGAYAISIKADGVNKAEGVIVIPEFVNQLTPNWDDADLLIHKLKKYAADIEQAMLVCKEKNITTDYEDSYLAILKKFIEYIPNEVAHNDVSRMGQYNYTFTRMYAQTMDSLESYLTGEKESLTVPKYVHGDIEIDGTSMLATTEMNGNTEVRPVFFAGYGPWETVAEEIPFFSSMGMNIIQEDFDMEKVLVTGRVNGWTAATVGTPNVVLAPSKEEQTSGEYSIRVKNPDTYTKNTYRYLYQEIAVKTNTTYVYGMKTKGTGLESNSAWFSVKGMALQGRTALENSDTWQSYEIEYTTGLTENQLNFTMSFEGIIDTLYIDDIYLIEKGTQENLLANGNIEENGLELMTSIEREAFDMGLSIDYSHLNWLKTVLAQAEKNHILVDVALCLHYLPQFILDENPSMTEHTEYFMPYIYDHDVAEKVHDIWFRLVKDTIEDYSSVYSLCILNEPALHANGYDPMDQTTDNGYYILFWQKYLQEKYTTIDALNLAYGSSYQSFEKVLMPENRETTPLFYDYRDFNETLLTGYIADIATAVKKYFPEHKIHAKVMDYFNHSWTRFILNGTNLDRLSGFTDFNGCDAFSQFGYANTPLTLKMGWYDMMTSAKDAPVWDTESHIMNDKNVPEYSDVMASYTGADVWNGALHGRGAQIIWLWDLRDGSMPWGWSNYPNSNMVIRPAEVLKTATAVMDLNRLSREVTAIQKKKPEVGLLYSRTSIGYSDDAVSSCTKAYEEILFSGQKVGFVTDEKPEAMHQYELLVVPGVTNIKADMLNEIRTFIQNGGRVIFTDAKYMWFFPEMKYDHTLVRYDEYDQAHDTEIRDYILNNSIVNGDISDTIFSMGLSEVTLIDTATGASPENVEWSYAEYDGRMVVNILNYDLEQDRTLKILYHGKEISQFIELRSMEAFDGDITVLPYEPRLVSFETFALDLLDSTGTVIEENINTIKSGTIRCNTDAEGTIILALYKDGDLLRVSLGKKTIEIPELSEGSYRLMVADWEMESLTPLTACRSITMEVEK